MKSATYAKINGKEIGKKPGDTTPGTDLKGEAKGDGSEANPFNSVAAQKYTAALEAGKATDKEFYIKGKVQSIRISSLHPTATDHSILPMMPTAPSSTSSASTTSVARSGRKAI